MDDQLILDLGIQPELPTKRPDLEAGKGEAHARELQQNLEINEASSLADTEATHTDHGSGRTLSLGLDIYDNNKPSEYG
jgi:hypothetical protein